MTSAKKRRPWSRWAISRVILPAGAAALVAAGFIVAAYHCWQCGQIAYRSTLMFGGPVIEGTTETSYRGWPYQCFVVRRHQLGSMVKTEYSVDWEYTAKTAAFGFTLVLATFVVARRIVRRKEGKAQISLASLFFMQVIAAVLLTQEFYREDLLVLVRMRPYASVPVLLGILCTLLIAASLWPAPQNLIHVL